MKYITKIPTGHEKSVFIVSVSGGKDSAALAAEMKRLAAETGIEVRYAFADTGWEAPETYEYLATMERVLGITIDRVGFPGGMRAKIRERAGFPARLQRWCTSELKVEPLRAYHARVVDGLGVDTVSVVGIRAEESESRARMLPFEDDERWGGYVWRPLIDWAIGDVLAAHHRAGLPVNPLYKLGHGRVGCWPCIYSSKEEVRLWAEHDPASVQEVAALEIECEKLRADRNAAEPGRYTHATASFFQARESKVDKTSGKRVYLPVHVDKVVEWSKTARGGVQLRLIQESPDSGCFRWGMCEPPEKGDE